MAKLIDIDGTITEVEPKNGTDFQLDELYGLLDCTMIETSPAIDGKLLVFDEEGAYKDGARCNEIATRNMHPSMQPFVFNLILGKALLCESSQLL